MWVKVVVAVEENVAPMLMLLPKNWWVYSENQGSFCQMGLKWISSDGELPEGYQNLEALVDGSKGVLQRCHGQCEERLQTEMPVQVER